MKNILKEACGTDPKEIWEEEVGSPADRHLVQNELRNLFVPSCSAKTEILFDYEYLRAGIG